MSKHFISFLYNKKEDTDDYQLSGIQNTDPYHKNDVSLPVHHTLQKGLLLPEFGDGEYIKCMIECTINLLALLSNNLTMKEGGNVIPLPFAMQMKHLTNILQWMIHSKSWTENELRGYDVQEIIRRLSLVFLPVRETEKQAKGTGSQYICNECGEDWADENAVICPECESEDIELL